METIGKVSVIALCMDYKLLFLCAWIKIDAHKCSTLVRIWFMSHCAFKADNLLNDARARGLLSSMNQTETQLHN